MAQNEQMIADILEIFRQKPTFKYTVDQISRKRRGRNAVEFSDLVKTLTFLENENKIFSNDLGQFQLVQEDRLVEGVFRANDKGFGFVRVDDEDEDDIFIAKPNTNFALDGDTVEVKIIKGENPWNNKGPEGQVNQILERGLKTMVGEFMPYSDVMVNKTGFYGYVKSKNRKLSAYSAYISKTGIHPQMGDMVKVEITDYPSSEFPTRMLGNALLTIGNKNDPGVDIMSLVYDNDIKTDFEEESLEQSNKIPDHIQKGDMANRRDIRDQAMVTIDGDDSKDFDDAVVVWKKDNGNYHLGVHIADVSHYVTENSPLDKEAFERGNSTYLVDRVIPMLPFRLSNGICSLNPDEDRLALSCDMELTPDGERVDYDIYASVIRSHGRLTYNNVNAVLDNNMAGLEDKYQQSEEMLHQMSDLHHALFNKRHQRGAIDFEENEAKIIVDQDGHAVDIQLRQRGTAEKMIESFMLMANETVAEHFNKKHVPFLYRVHETPEGERVTNFFEFISAFGLNIKADPNDLEPKTLQKILAKTQGTPEEPVVQTMMLRSLKQARYSEDQLGHFGLAAPYYTHFTSPIRRYPDLMVHRLIHQYIEKGATEKVKQHFESELPVIAEHSSQQERKSVDAERAVNDLKKTEYMIDKVGDSFDAVISSVTSFGMFVALENTVEGLIHITNLKDDFYSFDEKQLTLVGKKTNRQFKIGQPIKVTLIRADLEQRQIDFEIYDEKVEQEKRQVKRTDGKAEVVMPKSEKDDKDNGRRKKRPFKRRRNDQRDNRQSSDKRGQNNRQDFKRAKKSR
ncbi:ribonuclease R [Holzapfeliella sp. JNUCC 72]